MCGRYSLAPEEVAELEAWFGVTVPFVFVPRYNIAPTWSPGYEPPIVRVGDGGARELARARWWLIPEGWSKPLSALPTTFNARLEELERKPLWSRSFGAQRCLVPTTGYREFRGERGRRRAFQFRSGREPSAFAGLWSRWRAPEGTLVDSFAIVTAPANDVVRPVHDRMPLFVPPEQYATWLDPTVPGPLALEAVVKAPAVPLEVYECDPRGNDARREGPECIAPVVATQLDLFATKP